MESKKKYVKRMSLLFFLVVLLDVLCIAAFVMILNGNYDSPEFMGVDVTTVKGVFVVAMILYFVELVCTLFLAVKGLQVAKDTCKGTAHVKVAFVLFVLEVIGIVAMAVSFFLGSFNDWIQFVSGFASCALLYFYHKECKELAQ